MFIRREIDWKGYDVIYLVRKNISGITTNLALYCHNQYFVQVAKNKTKISNHMQQYVSILHTFLSLEPYYESLIIVILNIVKLHQK